MADTEKKINVVEIMKKIHREADDLYGKDEGNQNGLRALKSEVTLF